MTEIEQGDLCKAENTAAEKAVLSAGSYLGLGGPQRHTGEDDAYAELWFDE